MDAAAHIAELRAWHAMIAHRMVGFGNFPAGFEPATYARWRDVGALLMRIEALERDLAVIGKAPTDTALPIPGGPCEPHYVKGWNDAVRAAAPVLRTVFNRGRIEAKDVHQVEQWVLDALTTLRRTKGRMIAQDTTTALDPWSDEAR